MHLCKCICVNVFVYLYFCIFVFYQPLLTVAVALSAVASSALCMKVISREIEIYLFHNFFCFNHLFHSKRLSEVSFKHQKTNFSFSSSITFIQPEACAVGKPYLLWEARPVKMFLIKFSKCSQYIYFFPKTTLMDAFGSIGTGETWDVGRLGSSCIFNISLFWIEYSTFYPFYFDILLFWFKYSKVYLGTLSWKKTVKKRGHCPLLATPP